MGRVWDSACDEVWICGRMWVRARTAASPSYEHPVGKLLLSSSLVHIVPFLVMMVCMNNNFLLKDKINWLDPD